MFLCCDELNPSKLIVYGSLLVFSILLPLRIENTFQCDWFIIFIPLFVWKLIAILGAFIGFVAWLFYTHSSTAISTSASTNTSSNTNSSSNTSSNSSYVINTNVSLYSSSATTTADHELFQRLSKHDPKQFFNMLFLAAIHFLLLTSEIFICINLNAIDGVTGDSNDPRTPNIHNNNHNLNNLHNNNNNKPEPQNQPLPMQWWVVFIPLFLCSIIGLISAIVQRKRFKTSQPEIEITLAVLFVVFLEAALKLDGWIDWSWVYVFIPSFLILIVAVAILLVYMVSVLVNMRLKSSSESTRNHYIILLAISFGALFVIGPLLAFQILLLLKLQFDGSFSLEELFLPLWIMLSCLVLTSFFKKGGNPWWFGMILFVDEWGYDGIDAPIGSSSIPNYGSITNTNTIASDFDKQSIVSDSEDVTYFIGAQSIEVPD